MVVNILLPFSSFIESQQNNLNAVLFDTSRVVNRFVWQLRNSNAVLFDTFREVNWFSQQRCCENQLTSLNVSNNTALEFLNCHTNLLTTLDVSNNTALRLFCCDSMNDENGNNMLTTIYTYQGQTFDDLVKPNGAQLVVKPAN